MISYKNFKENIRAKNKKQNKFFRNLKLNKNIKIYNLSSVCNTVGYPAIEHTGKYFFLVLCLKDLLFFNFHYLKILFFYFFLKRIKKESFKKIENYKNNLIIENQWSLKKKKFSKTTKKLIKKKVFYDFNLQYLDFNNFLKIRMDKDFLCSLTFLKSIDLIKIFFWSIKIFLLDYKFASQQKLKPHISIRRIFYDLTKILSLEAMLEQIPIKKYIFFWENRGWQNHFLNRYTSVFIGIQCGVEGHLGPIYCDHKMRNELRSSTIFFESKFHFNHLKKKNKKLILINKNRKFKKKNYNKKNHKVLLLTGLDRENIILASKLVDRFKNFYLRPHPDLIPFAKQHTSQNKIKIDKINNYFFNRYDLFISLGVTSFVDLMEKNNINYLQLINPNKTIDGFDISTNKNIHLNQLENIEKLIQKSHEMNKNKYLFVSATKLLSYKDLKN